MSARLARLQGKHKMMTTMTISGIKLFSYLFVSVVPISFHFISFHIVPSFLFLHFLRLLVCLCSVLSFPSCLCSSHIQIADRSFCDNWHDTTSSSWIWKGEWIERSWNRRERSWVSVLDKRRSIVRSVLMLLHNELLSSQWSRTVLLRSSVITLCTRNELYFLIFLPSLFAFFLFTLVIPLSCRLCKLIFSFNVIWSSSKWKIGYQRRAPPSPSSRKKSKLSFVYLMIW